MKSFTTKLSLGLLLLFAISSIQAQGIDFFHGSFSEAQAKAKKESKLVFMDAYTTWCAPCKWMNANVFTDAQVAEYFNKHFVSMKMDMERGEGPELARKYRVVAYPSLFFLRPDGSVVKREVGMKNVNELLAIAKRVEATK